MVAPALGIFPLILDTVSLDGPLSWAFPFHYTTTFIGPQDNDEFTSTAQPRIAAVSASDICSQNQRENDGEIVKPGAYSFVT